MYRLVLAALACAAPSLAQTQAHGNYKFNLAPYTQGSTSNFVFVTPEASPDLGKGQCYASGTYFNPVCKAASFTDGAYSQQEIRPYYSTFQTANSDGSLAFFANGTGTALFYRTGTWTPFRTVTDANLGEGADPRWDTSGYYPRRVYYHDYYGKGCRLYRYDMSADGTSAASTLVHDFLRDFPNCVAIDMGGTGTSSTDTRYWAFVIRSASACTATSTDVAAIAVYDMNSDSIAGKLDANRYAALGGRTSTWNNCSSGAVYSTSKYRPDAADISPLGTKVMINWPRTNTGAFGDGAWVMNKDFSGGTVKVGSHDVHYGWAFDAAGNELVVSQHDGSHPVPGVGGFDGVAGININSGAVVRMLDQADYAYGAAHFARINNPGLRGWAIVSTYRDITTTNNRLDHHVLAVETSDVSARPRIWRIAETHGRYPQGPGALTIGDPGYSREPHANISQDGNTIFFGADWLTSASGSPGGYSVTSAGKVNAFYVTLPPSWWALLGSGASPEPPPSPTLLPLPVRVNAGGPQFTDSSGAVWAADAHYSGGSTYQTTKAIANTTTPALYQTERYQPGGFTYTFPVANGTYSVKLKFAEIWFTAAGQRVFNVSINGRQVLAGFDIFQAAGGAFKAVDRTFTVNVTGGRIDVQFSGVVENPKVNALEITAGGAAAPSAIRINSGGGAYTDPSGISWAADAGYSSGGTHATSNNISKTTNPKLYQTERYQSGGFTYQFAVPNGKYQVNLKFAEIWFTQAGKRVFTVTINRQTVLTNFDIVAAAGAFTAIDKAYPVTVTGGSITIDFKAVTENPKVNGIEILPQ